LQQSHNKIIQISKEIISQNTDLQHVTMGAWHTADFDSVWFQRAGMPCVTLAALDSNGKMPNIHRPTDTIENVDLKPMFDAIKLAEIVADKL
jgi:Iap family predicted aminopeptidase